MEDRITRSQEFDQGELVNQLREKVRSQAQRLRNLEQYRVLCEQRISEIVPGHNFPVKPEDLGSGLPTQIPQELNLAKQKISRLEQQLSQQRIKVPLADNYTFPPPTTQLTLAQLQELYSAIYYQHHDLMKEKNSVEESLRSEMLNCEEQRAYIEVLKQALESNLQELGLTGRTIEDIMNKRQGNEGSEEKLENRNMENKDLTDLLKLKTEECEQLTNERKKTDQHLQEAADALQYAEEEVQRLEEEKSALLDYIEEHSAKEKQFSAEIERIKKESGEFERKSLNALRELGAEQNHRKELERELESLKGESNRVEKSVRDSYENEINSFQIQFKQIEQRNESLQANNTTLSNTLKETQEELDNLKSQHDISIKETSTIRKSLSLTENKVEEVERSSQKFIEINKDLENKLQKSEKELKLFKEKKIKEIEMQYKNLVEEANNEIEELKIEIEKYLLKEKDLIKENTDLKKKFKKIQDDLAKYHENSSNSSQELLDLRKKLDSAQIEMQQIMFEKDKLQSDYQKIEFNLNSEKSSNALLQEEYAMLKEKEDENEKFIKGINENNREKENKLQNSAFEIENLKKNLSISLKDIENERQLKTQYYEEVLKLKKSQIYLTTSGTQIEESKKLISNFSSNFGAVSSSSNYYMSIVSSQFKDMLFKSNDLENIIVPEWIQNVCEELEALIRRLSEYKQDLGSVTQKLSATQNKLDNLSIDENALRDRERTLRYQIENLSGDKEKLQNDREIMIAKIQNSQNELSALKKELQMSVDEAQRLRDQLNYSTTETVQWRSTAETDVFAIRAIEEKANLLLKEKKELETLLNKLQSAVPSTDLQRIFLEIMKCHGELEVINRERLRIENQLLRSEGEMRSHSRNHQQEKAIQLRREVENLRAQLSNCDSQIVSYKRRVISLDEEMQEVEKCERRRYALHMDTEKEYVHMHSELDFKNKELQNSQLSVYDLKKKQETIDKHSNYLTPQPMYAESSEDRPLLSYFDKLRRARNLVSDLKDQE